MKVVPFNTRAQLVFTTTEASKVLGIHRSKLNELLRERDIKGFKLGADWRIPKRTIELLLGKS